MPQGKRRARRQSDKPDRNQAEGHPHSAADQLRAALNELSEPPRDRRLRRHKQHHIDDYRETVLDGSDSTALSQALLELTEQTHGNRRRLLPEEASTVKLSDAGAEDRESAQHRAAKAAQDLRENMKKHGVRERTHYYSATEPREVGEIDRTYKIPPPFKRP
ncbi:MAG: hypothetical protein MUQ65_14300 [Armatimonadetes bacterium]|nr:hypothetical protein [Armatimonadota bacterium]